jgi:hypothetical protein
MIQRRHVPHALLAALSIQDMEPEKLREHGRLFGNPHAVNVAIERLRRSGYIEVKVRLTSKGQKHLKGKEQ